MTGTGVSKALHLAPRQGRRAGPKPSADGFGLALLPDDGPTIADGAAWCPTIAGMCVASAPSRARIPT
ncbi:hypothetical protein [Kitasatospora sp. NPDC093558]|uniref:hypothetical protein n=1 Tax=Kitasatospora sp. NPDC093558 TaxID=3155201 RepID=UPI003412B392